MIISMLMMIGGCLMMLPVMQPKRHIVLPQLEQSIRVAFDPALAIPLDMQEILARIH